MLAAVLKLCSIQVLLVSTATGCMIGFQSMNITLNGMMDTECCGVNSVLLAIGGHLHCFAIHYQSDFDQRVSWADAQKKCSALRGNIITISNNVVQNKMQQALNFVLRDKNNDDVWLGLHRERGGSNFRWISGSRAQYRNWAAHTPSQSNGCVAMGYVRNSQTGLQQLQWFDSPCNAKKIFVCEYILTTGDPQSVWEAYPTPRAIVPTTITMIPTTTTKTSTTTTTTTTTTTATTTTTTTTEPTTTTSTTLRTTSTTTSTPSPIPTKSSTTISSTKTTLSTTILPTSGLTPRPMGRPVYTSVPQACLVAETQDVSWENTLTGLYAITKCPKGTVGVGWWLCSPVTGMDYKGPDYSNCTQPWVASMVNKVHSEANVSPVPVITNLTVSIEQSITLEPGDIVAIGDLLPTLINRQMTRMENETKIEKENSVQRFARATATLGSSLLSPKTLPTWSQINKEKELGVATTLMTSMEHSGFLLADSQSTNLQRMKRENIVIESRQFDKSLVSKDRSLVFSPDIDGLDPGTSISIPSTALESEYNNVDHLSVVFVLYDTIDQVLPNSSKSLQNVSSMVINSKVISASVVKPGHGIYFDHNQEVTVAFKHYKHGLANTSKCVFLDMSLYPPAWSTRGCLKRSENATYTVCACNHLTNFAVLMDIGGTVGKMHSSSDQADSKALSVITLVGCIISIICLLACVITFTVFRSLRCLRNVIHRNLCLCLLLAEILFLAGVDKTQSQVGCAIVAGFLHFFFLAAFAWMCLEGFQLYLLVIEVFESKNCRTLYFYLTGYGTPAIIVAISAIARPSGYGTSQFCWLSTEHLFILSFAIPVSVTAIINTIILIIAMRVVVSHNKEQSTKNKIRLWLKGSAILVCLLGLTWIFGFLYLTRDLMAFAYIFTILNSFQGLFIFIFHCAMNDNVQNQYKKILSSITCLPCDFRDKYRDSRSLSVNHTPEHYSRQTSTTFASKKHSLV